MRRRLALGFIASPIALLLLGGAAAAAQPPTVTALSTTSFGSMVVDGVNGHVYVSSPADGQIDVMNPDGSLDTTISDPHAGSMALSTDASTLYVGESGQNQIDTVDTSTLAVTGSFAASVASDIVVAGGRLWYINNSSDLTSVSLDSSHTESPTSIALVNGTLRTTPSHPNWLLAGQIDAANINLYDVSNPSSVTQLATSSEPGHQLHDFEVAPDGSRVVATYYPYLTESLTLPSLVKGVKYLSAEFDALAVSPLSGKVAMARYDNGYNDLNVYPIGGGTGTGRTVAGDSWTSTHYIAYSANGVFIYLVAPTQVSGTESFRVIQATPLTGPQFSLKSSAATITYGAGVKLSVHLGVTSANRTVQIYRLPFNAATSTLAATLKLGTAGNATFTAHPSMDTEYVVKWSGDAAHLAANVSHDIYVKPAWHRKTVGGYRTVGGVRLYHYAASCPTASHKGCPAFQAWTAPLQPNRKILFVAEGKTPAGHWVTISKGAYVTSGGKLGLTLFYRNRSLVGVNQRIQFRLLKNGQYAAATSSWLPYRVTS